MLDKLVLVIGAVAFPAVAVLLIVGLVVATWFCVIGIRDIGTRPRPDETLDQHMMRGCLAWGCLLLVLAALVYLVSMVAYVFVEVLQGGALSLIVKDERLWA